MHTLFTTAPASYDFATTTEVTANVGTIYGKTVREVYVPVNPVDALSRQQDRYLSGMHMATTEDVTAGDYPGFIPV